MKKETVAIVYLQTAYIVGLIKTVFKQFIFQKLLANQ